MLRIGFAYGVCAVLGLAALGCSDSKNNGGQDMATGPDMTSTAKFGGNAYLTAVQTKANVGGTLTNVTRLVPVVGFSPLGPAAVKPTYDDRQGIFGCVSRYFGPGQNLGSDSDAGEITISGYSGANFVDGSAAPAQIVCDRVMVGGLWLYQCGFGPFSGTTPGKSINTPFPANTTLFKAGQTINVKLAGGADVGAVDSKMDLTGVDVASVTEDLNTLKFDGAQDITIHFTCPSEGCGMVTAVNVMASQNDLDHFDQPSPTSGTITCSQITTSQVTIKADAIKGMLHGDAALKTIQVGVVRTSLPLFTADAMKDQIGMLVGGGAVGYISR